MRCRTAFAELMTSLILWPVIKHTAWKSSRESGTQSTAFKVTPQSSRTCWEMLSRNQDTLDLFLALPNMLRNLLQSDQGSLNKTLKRFI